MRPSKRTTVLASVYVIAIALVWMMRNSISSPSGAMTQIGTATQRLQSRPVEARLSGSFPFHPYREGAYLQYRQALNRVTRPPCDAASAQSRSEASHCLAIVDLLSGRLDSSIILLQRSLAFRGTETPADLIGRTSDVDVLIDYAAASYERAMRQAHPLDLPVAFAASDRANALAPDRPEPYHTRALVCEYLHFRKDAIVAWRAYLQRESDVQWAAEAQRHLDSLNSAPRPAPAFRPQEARMHAEELLLGTWGSSTLRDDRVAADRALNEAAALGEALVRQGGDGIVTDSVKLIRNVQENGPPGRVHDLAAAHLAYLEARIAYVKARDANARRLIKVSADLLDAAGSPLALQARIYLATITSYFGQNSEALQLVQETVDRLGSRARNYRIAAAQAYWTRGLIQFGLGMPYDSLKSYETASSYAAGSEETSTIAGIETVLVETYRYLGDSEQAWLHQVRAFQALDGDDTYIRHQIATSEAAFATLDLGFPQFAQLLIRRLSLDAAAKNDPIFKAQAAVTSAQIALASHRFQEAAQAADAAEAILSMSPPTSSSVRLFADVAIFRAEAIMAQEPTRAIESLRTAVKRLTVLEHSSRLPRVYLLLGRSHMLSGDRLAAERAFTDGVEVLERQRDDIATDIQRSTFTDTGRALYDDVIRLMINRGETSLALQMVRRARSMGVTVPGGLSGNSETQVDQRVGNEVLIEYYLLPEALLAWVSAGGETTFAERHLPFERVASMVDAANGAIMERKAGDAWRESAAVLYDVLILPVAESIHPEQPLLIAPDGILHRVAFATLVDRRTRRPIVAEHSVSIVLGRIDQSRREPYRSILVVAAPSVPGFERLDSVIGESRRTAATFKHALVLDGPTATPSRMLSELDRFDIVHYAGHATCDERQPQMATLRLVPDNSAQDGALHAFEVSSRHFRRTSLVVLAACNTSRGPVAGAGVLSFARTFVAAGVPRVVGSLWPADDQGSARFFARFYQALGHQLDPAEALRAAQLAGLERDDEPPQTWAAFQVYRGGLGGKRGKPVRPLARTGERKRG